MLKHDKMIAERIYWNELSKNNICDDVYSPAYCIKRMQK